MMQLMLLVFNIKVKALEILVMYLAIVFMLLKFLIPLKADVFAIMMKILAKHCGN